MLNTGDKVLCVCNITLSFEDCIDYGANTVLIGTVSAISKYNYIEVLCNNGEIAFVTQNSEIVKLKG